MYRNIRSCSKLLVSSIETTMARQPNSMLINKMYNSRNLTTATSNAVHKLQAAVELYRVKNYSQELPSRCKKEIVQAANVNKDNHIEERDLLQILCNIGAQDIVSETDLHNIILELGDRQNNTISVHQLINIL